MNERPPAVLVLHGLGGGPHELEPLIGAIGAAGHAVEAPVYPGHGGPGPRMPRSTWPEWHGAVERTYERLSERHRRISVVGFSTGCVLGLHLASRRPVDRLALLAPFLAVRHRWYHGLRAEFAMRTVGRWLREVPRRSSAVSDRRLRAELDRRSAFRTFNLDAARSAVDLIRVVRGEVAGVTAPALIVQSRRDSVVDPLGARWLFDHLGTPESDRRLVWLERSDHLVALDVERVAVIEAVLGFLGSGGEGSRRMPDDG